MPNKIEKLPDGNMTVELETGEKFSGDPLEVTTKLAEAQVNTKRWGQGFKQELETIKANPPQPVSQPQPVDANEKQLQEYLLTQQAKALGYNTADEYKADLQRVRQTTERVNTNLVITDFFNLCPDFPNTNEASEALAKKIDEMKWDFTPQAMTAAHALLVREHAQDPKRGYAPLTPEQVNAAWSNNMQQANRLTAPPMIHGTNPEQQLNQGGDPYAMKLDELRKMAIAQELNK